MKQEKQETRRSRRVAAIAGASVALLVAGCSTGSGGSDLVTVRNDPDYYNLEAAQRTADRECAARGAGRAQFVMIQNNPRSAGGQGGGTPGGPPEIIYRCTPAQ